jgi:hypothetical protein
MVIKLAVERKFNVGGARTLFQRGEVEERKAGFVDAGHA